MSVIHQEKENPIDLRVILIPALLLAGLCALFFRLWFLQVVLAESLTEKMQTTRSTQIKRLAPRGLIVDRDGMLLAGVRPQIVVTAQPRPALKNEAALHQVAALLGRDPKQIMEKLTLSLWRPYVPAAIQNGVSIETATKIAEAGEGIHGFAVDSVPMRFYPDSVNFAHILGYVWTPSDRDVDRLTKLGVKPADYVGKVGLEYVHEKDLMGVPSTEEMEVDAKRRPVRMVARDNATPGKKLVLSIDSDVQRAAMEQLRGRRGAVVAIDPRSGEVLCLASSPTYDAASFLGGISTQEFEALQTDEGLPQINRAISTGYAPGSTFKIVTTVAAMMAGKFSPSYRVFCPGFYKMGNRRFRCLGHHGSITYATALAKSCNTYFASMAVDAGPNALRRACAALGLGQRTGIDLVGESRGIVPTDEWIKRWRKPPVWYGGDTVNFGIGQGELSTTPIQMANMMAIVANRGVGYKPHLVRALEAYGVEGKPELVVPEQAYHIEASDAFWDSLHSALNDVLTQGTARGAMIQDLAWAGKTGSAENRQSHQTHSWFVCFAPLKQPKIAMAVVVENAGHGSEVAAPIARDLVRRYLRGSDAKVTVRSQPSVSAADSTSTATASELRPSSR